VLSPSTTEQFALNVRSVRVSTLFEKRSRHDECELQNLRATVKMTVPLVFGNRVARCRDLTLSQTLGDLAAGTSIEAIWSCGTTAL
jgi:hypothetical protein